MSSAVDSESYDLSVRRWRRDRVNVVGVMRNLDS